MLPYFYNWLLAQGVALETAVVYARWIAAGVTLLLCVAAYLGVRYLLLPLTFYSLRRSNDRLKATLKSRKLANRISLFAPAVVVYLMAPVVLESFAPFVTVTQSAALIYLIVMGVLIANVVVEGLQTYYLSTDATRSIPIKGFMQVVQIVIYFVGVLLILAILLDRTPLYLLSGLGALTAILAIAFRDPLLGLVAGVQLTANDLVARGDWIELPKYDASGEVLEVALTTVKIRNADQSITTVPTYSLISESFKNWRGIEETRARRIKRILLIDSNTVRFCAPEMRKRLEQLPRVRAAWSARPSADETDVEAPVTNLTLFRDYVIGYLRQHPALYPERTLLVRQLDATPHGLPLEIYVYSRETDFAAFEALQADILAFLVATLPEFGLRAYQAPAGSDVRSPA